MDEIDDDDQVEITRKVVADCLRAMSEGDPDAGLVMAYQFLGDIPNKCAFISIAVVEALVMQSAQLGSENAKDFLNSTWPKMKPIVINKLGRRGLK